MKTNLKLSAILCGLACIAPQLALAEGNVKQIEVCNNFPSSPIYLTLSSNKTILPEERTKLTPGELAKRLKGEDKWLKGKEIAAGKCLPVTIPLEHFGGGRAYIFDKAPADDPDVWSDYNSDGNFQLVEFSFRGPGGEKAHGTLGDGIGYNFSAVDSVSSAIPLAVEATFIDPEKAKVMEVDGDKQGSVEFTGNPAVPNQAELDAAFKELVGKGWPYYPKSSKGGHYKIPGGYNALSYNKQNGMWAYAPEKGNQPITPEELTNRWKRWVDPNSRDTKYINCSESVPQSPNPGDPKYTKEFCEDFQKTAKMVWDAFVANRELNKPDRSFSTPDLYTEQSLVQHITGYSIFNETSGLFSFADLDAKKIGPKWTHLAQGVPNVAGDKDLDPKYLKYRYPVYDSPYNLDPYVTAIHKHFKMNVYAFSINDEVGYFDVPKQDKLVIAVGGLKGLPNQNQRIPTPASKYNVTLGAGGLSGWDSIDACGLKKTFNKKVGGDGPRVPLLFVDSNSCDVKILRSPLIRKVGDKEVNFGPKIELHFKVVVDNQKLLPAQGCTETVDGKVINDGPLCRGVLLNTNTYVDINTPPPN